MSTPTSLATTSYHNPKLAAYVLQLQDKPMINASRLPINPASLYNKTDGSPVELLAYDALQTRNRTNAQAGAALTGNSNKPADTAPFASNVPTASTFKTMAKGSAIGGTAGLVSGGTLFWLLQKRLSGYSTQAREHLTRWATTTIPDTKGWMATLQNFLPAKRQEFAASLLKFNTSRIITGVGAALVGAFTLGGITTGAILGFIKSFWTNLRSGS